jgi:hypothetical protein
MCKRGHEIRGPQDRDRYNTCIRCRRISQREYTRRCREAYAAQKALTGVA